jgi:hypothetical protein
VASRARRILLKTFLVEENDHELGTSVSTLIRHTALEHCICEHVSLKEVTTVEHWKAETVFMGWFWQKKALHLPAVFVKEYVIPHSRNVSRSLINVKTCSVV